jgi:hypothetical protein
MIYNFQNDIDILKFNSQSEFFKKNGKTVDLIEKKNTRSTKQNSALHMLFRIVSEQLNEMGLEFQYFGLKGNVLEMRYNTEIVKNHIWRPIQETLFDIKSTTKINTEQINEIMDVLIKFFAERGIVIEFPSKEQLEKLINN